MDYITDGYCCGPVAVREEMEGFADSINWT